MPRRCYDDRMPELSCTARRVGDYESRTEEYEVSFAAGDAPGKTLRVMYQAARAFEINAALDECAEAARAAITEADPDLAYGPTDESLSQLAWKTLQSADGVRCGHNSDHPSERLRSLRANRIQLNRLASAAKLTMTISKDCPKAG